ncbi:MAG: S8 family serine peptidase [Nitrospirae bacterium]|nr:S8 family serine peptidase [Nitrospirota bacterium]
MKKLLYLFLTIFLISCGSEQTANISSDTSKEISTSSIKVTAQSIISQMEKGNYKEGELLVRFKPGVVKASAMTHQHIGSAVIKGFDIVPNLEHVKLPEGMSVEEGILHYMSDPDVEYAEPNYIRRVAAVIPNDTFFRNQWALHNTGTYAYGTPDADIDAPEAWTITTGSSNIIIAVLDTGIDYNHNDLAGNIWTNPGETSCIDGIDNDENGYIDDCIGWNFANNNKAPMDDNGHGTHVAGIIGAVGNNGNGIAGVMWNVRLMPVKVLDSNGAGTDAEITSGIQYAVANGAKIINASLGGPNFSYSAYVAIATANAHGVLFVAAAGNNGNNNDLSPFYPASYDLPNIISVAATDQDDSRVPFSNYGEISVDVAAPGVYVLSTIPQGLYRDKDFSIGTSTAAPHVAGLAGLLMSYYNGYHNAWFNHHQIRETILRYVDVLDTLNGWIRTGGRINAYSAVSSLLAPTNLTASATSPTRVALSWSDNATGEDGYVIERMTAGESWILLTLVPSGYSSYTDNTVAGNNTYTYRVRAFNNIGESFNSAEATVTTPAREKNGGGCSIGTNQNTPSAMANLAVLMIIPLIFTVIMRRRR